MENDHYEIEENVPIPNRTGTSIGGPIYQALENLTVGQSFVVTGLDEGRRLHHSITYLHKKSDKKFTRRVLQDDKGKSIHAWRVWRTA